MKSLVLADAPAMTFTRNERILYFLIAAFFISLFFANMPVLNNICVGAIFLHSFFYNTLAERRRLLLQRKAVLFMLLFFLLHIVSTLFSANHSEAIRMLVMRLPLLIFPLSIGLMTIREELRARILLCYCTVTTIAALACMGFAFGRYLKFHDTVWLYDDNLSLLTGRQSIYIAMMVNLALFSFVYLLQKKALLSGYIGLVYGSMAFLLVFHFMLASRVALIILYGSFVCLAVYYMVKKRRIKEGGAMLIGLLIAAALLVKFFPKTLNRFKELQYTGYTYTSHAAESHYNGQLTPEQWNGANIRLAVWRCGLDLAREHLLLGVPLGDKEDKLMEIYRARGFDLAVSSRRNLHNTYLDTLCCFGIFGLALFLAGWLVAPLIRCYRKNDGWGAFVILGFAVSMMTEAWFDRSIGCLLAAFFLSLVAAYSSSDFLKSPREKNFSIRQ